MCSLRELVKPSALLRPKKLEQLGYSSFNHRRQSFWFRIRALQLFVSGSLMKLLIKIALNNQ